MKPPRPASAPQIANASDHAPPGGDAREARRLRVRADRVEVAAPRRPAQDGSADERDADREPGERRQAERLLRGEVQERVGQLERRDLFCPPVISNERPR